jgi:hypothetical protein
LTIERGAYVRNEWKKTQATIVSSLEYRSAGAVLINSVDFTYEVDGGYYYGKFTTFGSFEKGQVVSLFYDPTNPERNNLQRREQILRWLYVVFFTLVAALVIYGFVRPHTK